MKRQCELGEKGGFADAWLAGQKIDAAFGEAGTQDTVELTDAGRKGVAGLGRKSCFDGETFGRFEANFLAGFGSGGFEEGSGLDERIPLVASRALTGPLGKFVATAVAEKDGGGFGHLGSIVEHSAWLDFLSVMGYNAGSLVRSSIP